MAPAKKTCVLPAIGQTRASAVTASQLQGLLNALAKAGRSHSAIKKARTHLKAMFELAVDDKILDVSPARRITMPKRIRKVDDTYADRTVVHKLFDAAGSRDRILLRLFVSCGLRPQEAFAPPEGWLFPASRGGGPIRPNSYVKRDLARLAQTAGVCPIDLRRLRRTCATYLRDEAAAQGQLRHTSVETTKRHYLRAIPAEQKSRVERLDRELFGPQKVVALHRSKRPA